MKVYPVLSVSVMLDESVIPLHVPVPLPMVPVLVPVGEMVTVPVAECVFVSQSSPESAISQDPSSVAVESKKTEARFPLVPVWFPSRHPTRVPP